MENQNYILVDGVRPLLINKKTLIKAFGGATKTVDRLLYCARYHPELDWLRIGRPGSPGVECLIDTASAESAYRRIMAGEEPPVLPSELKSKSKLLNLSDETAPRRELGKPKKLAQPKQ
jgi:hypothetical protein